MTCFFKIFERTELTEPEDPEENATCIQVSIWEAEVKEHIRRKAIRKSNETTGFVTLYGQCSRVTKDKLHELED